MSNDFKKSIPFGIIKHFTQSIHESIEIFLQVVPFHQLNSLFLHSFGPQDVTDETRLTIDGFQQLIDTL